MTRVSGLIFNIFCAFFLVISAEDLSAKQALPIKTNVGQSIKLNPVDGLQLQGTGGDFQVSWSWLSKPSLSVAAFSDASILRPSVAADVPGTYVALMQVMNHDGVVEDEITVTFGTENLPPVAYASAAGLPGEGSPVTVDGSGSFDVEGDSLTYTWSVLNFPNGSAASIIGDGPVVKASLDLAGQYRVSLIVEDEMGNQSSPKFVDIEYDPNGGSLDVYRVRFDSYINADATLAETFDFGERRIEAPTTQSGLGDDLVFDYTLTNEGTVADTLQFSLGGVPYSVTGAEEMLSLVSALSNDSDPFSVARISTNKTNYDLTIIFSQFGGSVTLQNVIDDDAMSHKDLDKNGVEYYTGTGNRIVAPNTSARFDQLNVEVGQALRVDPYASTDIDGDWLSAHSSIKMSPFGSETFVTHDIHGLATLTPDIAGDFVVSVKTEDSLYTDSDYLLVVADEFGLANVRPVARIEEPSEVQLGATAFLDGTQSYDLNGDLIEHKWSLISAPAFSTADIDFTDGARSSFTPDLAGNYVVQLSVSDGEASGLPVTKLIKVAPNLPVAKAGRDLLSDNALLSGLDGNLSSGNGALVHYWSSLGMTGDWTEFGFEDASASMTGVLLDTREARFNEIIASENVYHIMGRVGRPELTCIFDTRRPADLSGSASEPINVTLHGRGVLSDVWTNGVQTPRLVWEIENKKDVTRHVSLIDADGVDHGSYDIPGRTSLHVTTEQVAGDTLYAQIDGQTYDQSGPDSNEFSRHNPVCVGPASGVVQLIVGDSVGVSSPDTIFVGNTNLRPELSPGSKITVVAGQAANLNAAPFGYDANGDSLEYGWALISRPSGSASQLTNNVVSGETLAFTPDVAGIYLLQLTATDGELLAEPAIFEVELLNSPPVAVASGPAEVFVGETADLSGLGSSDPDGHALSYQWVVLTAPDASNAIIQSADQALAEFIPDVRGDYSFGLTVSDYEFSSEQAVWNLTVPNRAPIAALDGPNELEVGVEGLFSATASSDPDGDELSYSFAITNQPSGSAPEFQDLGNGQFGFGALQPGQYTIEVSVSDGVDTATASVAVVVLVGNNGPILAPLQANYTVELGLEFALDLQGSDPDGDPISFFATPLPLASGIGLDASNGEVRFRPEAGQIGQYVFTVGVSDGVLTDEATLTIDVVEPTAGTTAIHGRVLDANDFAGGVETPLANMPVRLRDAALMTTTDANGVFNFGSLSAGTDQVFVEPSADGGPGGYQGTTRVITVTENQDRDISPDLLLTPLNDGCAPVVAGVDTSLVGTVSGVQVTIPADSVETSTGAAYSGEICLGSLPQLFQHPGFDADTQACQIYALDAPGAVFTQAINISGPNVDALPEQARLQLWRTNPLNGLFRPAGSANVDTGAATVTGTLTPNSSGMMFTFLPLSPATTASADQASGNQYYSPFTGDNATSYTLPGYTAFGEQQNVGLSYHSKAADPTVLLAGDVTIADDASLPVSLKTRISVGGLSINDTNIWTPREGLNGATPALIGEAVSMRQTAPVDGSGLASGRYGYQFIARAQYACSTVSAEHSAEFYVQNESDSPYGNGWAIAGLQKLEVSPDGKVSIHDDMGVATFDPKPTLTEFDGEPLEFPIIGSLDIETADFDNDGDTDFAILEPGRGEVSFFTNYGGKDIQYTAGSKPAREDQNIAVEVPETGIYFPDVVGISAGDLTQDGIPDIAYALQSPRYYGYIENDGYGEFSLGMFEYTGIGGPRDITIEDLDQDGFQDILFLRTFGQYNYPHVSWGSEANTYTRASGAVTIDTHSRKNGLQIITGDVDGDGALDVAFRTDGGMSFFFNHVAVSGNPRGYRTEALIAGTGGVNLLGKYAAIHDFDSDGLMDVVYSNETELQFVRNLTGREFADPVILPRPPSADTAMFVALGDADGDGLTDIIASGNGEVVVYSSNGDGTFKPFESGLVDYSFNEMALADLNEDGSLDLISTSRFVARVHYSQPSASGEFVSGNGEFSTLVRLEDGTWQRTYKDGTVVEYDENGLQTALVDTQGNRKTYAYDTDGRLASITDQVGGVTLFTYEPVLGRLATVTYPDGRVTSFEFDDAGNLTEAVEPTFSTVSFSYDEEGRLISSTNQNGNTSNYSYDAMGNLMGVELPDGSAIANQVASSLGLIDGLGDPATHPLRFVAPEDQVTTVTDRKGQVTEIVVNEFGATVQVTDPLGRVTNIERDLYNLVVRVERPSDAIAGGVRVDTLDYDARGNVTRWTEAEGTAEERTKLYTYEDAFNKVLTETDPDGYVTSYDYDAFGEVTRITDAEGGEQLFSYTTEGKLASRTDKNGNATGFAYNSSQNLETVTYADGSVTQMTYDASGNTSVIAEASGTGIERQVHRTFDALNRVLTVETTGADGIQIDGVTQYSYLPAGNLETVTDETGLVTSMSYDEMERLVSVDDPAEGLIQRTYNEAGEVIAHINGQGETHQYAYDNVSRLTQTTDPEGYVKAFAYDSRDNIQTVTDGRGGLTSFAYDGLDRMTTRTNPISEVMARAYDGRGNLATLTREDGIQETATYDGLGRRTQVVTPDNTLSYAYDAQGNLTEAADDDSRVTFTYDNRNRLETTTTDGTVGPQPQVTLTYTYDALDRRLTMSDSLGGTTTYAYDPEDRLTDLTAPWGTVYSFGYDSEGRRTSLTSTSGRDTSYGYTNGLLSALTHAQSGVMLSDHAYQYDPDGQLTAIIDKLDPSKSKAISYDDLNRLIQVAEGLPVDQGGVPVPIEDYAYDEEGNRTASHLSALYSSNAHNQLEADDNYTYVYDVRGNRISRTSKVDGSTEAYSFDSQNRLVGYQSDSVTATYAYDALDRRIAKAIGSAVEAFIYDPWDVNSTIANDVVLDFEGGILTTRWLHGTTVDEPIGFERYAGTITGASGQNYEILEDQIGSPVSIIDASNNQLVANYTYESFGERSATGSVQQRYGFTGRETDDESGLIYFRARHYDPKLGQFLQRDPIGFSAGDFNLYTYAWNDPYTWTDPSGLAVTSDYTRLTAGVVGLAVTCYAWEPCNDGVQEVTGGAVGTIGAALSGLSGLISGALSQIGIYNSDSGSGGSGSGSGDETGSATTGSPMPDPDGDDEYGNSKDARDAKKVKSNKQADKTARDLGYDDAHHLKREFNVDSRYDIYVNSRSGNVYVGPKNGAGEFQHVGRLYY